jgi:hypothetical protein
MKKVGIYVEFIDIQFNTERVDTVIQVLKQFNVEESFISTIICRYIDFSYDTCLKTKFGSNNVSITIYDMAHYKTGVDKK